MQKFLRTLIAFLNGKSKSAETCGKHTHLYIYLHNWSLQSFSQDYDLASHTTNVACVNFIHEQRDLQFKSIPSDRFSGNSLQQFYLLSEFLPEICREEVGKEKFSYFHFDV